MNLERYRVPAGVWEGEWLELPDSDGARFLVKLPAPANREWQREVLELIANAGVRLNDKGSIDTREVDAGAFIAFRHKRLEAFARLCVVRCPEGFKHESLTQEFWPALAKLYELAEARVAAQAQEVEQAVGESQA